MPPTLKLSSQAINTSDLGEYKGVISENQFHFHKPRCFLKPRCHSHYTYLRKFPEGIRITEIATSALMRGSPPNFCYIIYIYIYIGQLEHYKYPQKSCFRIRMEGKPIEEGKISQKDLTRGKPTEGIRKGECL